MKKLILLIFLFQISVLFAQKAEWGNWQSVSCYQGFQTSCINYGFNKNGNGYEWNWKVKSNYNKKVSFNVAVTIGNDKQDWGRFTLSTYSEHKHVSMFYNNASVNITIEITKVCFSDNFLDNCWAECDNGNPNQPICDKKSNTTTTTSNSTNTNTQQNDLTEYNRSKVEMEEKIQVENERIQRENQERAKRSQQFINVYNEGVDLGNTGKYAEAKAKYQEAIGLATTNEQTQQAQSSYESMRKTQGTSEIINVLGKGIQDLTLAFAQEKEKKRLNAENQKREAEIETQKKKEKNELLNQQIVVANNGKFETQLDLAFKYFTDLEFVKSEQFFELAAKNKDKDKYDEILIQNELKQLYSLNKKEQKLWSLIKDNKSEFIRNMLILNSENYFTKTITTDDLKQDAIKSFVQSANFAKDNDEKYCTLAYYQVTGQYSNNNLIPKNEAAGMRTLIEYTKYKKNENYKNYDLALYYLGMLHLNGTSKIKPNENDAFNYFMLAINSVNKNVKEKNDLIYIYKPNPIKNLHYFNGAIQSYIQIAKILSNSKKEKDNYINKYLKERFMKYYKNLVPSNALYLYE